jgi:hypothetical protein
VDIGLILWVREGHLAALEAYKAEKSPQLMRGPLGSVTAIFSPGWQMRRIRSVAMSLDGFILPSRSPQLMSDAHPDEQDRQ